MQIAIRNLNTMNVGIYEEDQFIQMVKSKAKKEITNLKKAVETYVDKFIPDCMMISVVDGDNIMSAHEYITGGK